MRAFMDPSEARQGTSGDEGAVAVIVAILLVLLIGIAAFTIDFGAAYNSKRQLQVSADASSLAAAGELARRGVTCPIWTMADENAARNVASSVMDDNHGAAAYVTPLVPEDDFITCANGDYPDQVVVTWRNEATTDVSLGAVFGMSSITTNRVARSVVNQAAVGGLRPLALCSGELPAVTPSQILMNFDGHTASGACDDLPGNWRRTDCPSENLNSNVRYKEVIENGCADPVIPVAGQPAPGPGLTSHLLAACPAGPPGGGSDEDCLGGSTGQVFGGPIEGAWIGLLGDTLRLPVVCSAPDCPPDGAFDGSGNNAQFPIQKIAEITVCGVNRHEGPIGPQWSAVPNCAGAVSLAGDPGDNWLVLNIQRILEHDDPDVGSNGPGSVNLVD